MLHQRVLGVTAVVSLALCSYCAESSASEVGADSPAVDGLIPGRVMAPRLPHLAGAVQQPGPTPASGPPPGRSLHSTDAPDDRKVGMP